jgi:hypothetical protein
LSLGKLTKRNELLDVIRRHSHELYSYFEAGRRRQTNGRNSAIAKAAADSASYLSLCRTAAAALRQTPGTDSAITTAAADCHEYPLATTLERKGERSRWSP